MTCNCITDKPKIVCELCEKMFCDNCIYLICFICHKKFTCFNCGFKERQKYFVGLHSAVICKRSYIHCCKKHIECTINDKQSCEQIDCKICKFNSEYGIENG